MRQWQERRKENWNNFNEDCKGEDSDLSESTSL